MASKRRRNNEGCVTLRQDGRWQAIISLGYQGGKRKRRSVYGRTADEVSKKLTELMHKKDRGLPIPQSGTSLNRYLERWLGHVRPSIRPKTYTLFEMIVRVHIAPEIGRYRLERISPDMVQDLLNRKLASGLSPQSVRHIRTVLNLALKKAVRWDFVVRNAAALTDGPKVEHKPVHPLSLEEAQRLLAVVEASRLSNLYIVALALGLRRGELLGLAWDHVAPDARTVTLSQSLQRVERRLQLLPLKTKSSAATLPLPERAASALRQQHKRQEEEQLRAGPDWKGNVHKLVFTSLVGTPLEPTNVSWRHFKKMLAKAGIDPHRWNDVRHTCATLLFDHGADVKDVQTHLRHSRASTTMDIYVHQTPSARTDTASRMDQILGAPSERNPTTKTQA